MKLADYHTRLGDFTRARQVFEEALSVIQTTRDFGIVFNAYSKLEEELVNVLAAIDSDEEVNMTVSIFGQCDLLKVIFIRNKKKMN